MSGILEYKSSGDGGLPIATLTATEGVVIIRDHIGGTSVVIPFQIAYEFLSVLAAVHKAKSQ